MKPLLSDIQDTETLLDLGRASVQIVHDLKNQLNGLKLYATFLRKRMEKSERPEDERETIGKLIAGLERAAADMTTLVRYGRTLELRRQPAVDLLKLVSAAIADDGAGIELAPPAGALTGEFDPALMTEAIKAITVGALSLRHGEGNRMVELSLQEDSTGGSPVAVIEWAGLSLGDGAEPFRSFAGSDALRMSLAAKIIRAHGGAVGHTPDRLSVRLPLMPMN